MPISTPAARTHGVRLFLILTAALLATPAVPAAERGDSRSLDARAVGRALLEQGRTDEALRYLLKVQRGSPDDPELMLLIGKTHSLTGEVEDEIAWLSRAITIDPELAEAHFLLALAYDEIDNSPKVLQHAQRAIRLNPDYKEKLKSRIRDSNVSRKIGAIVTRLLEDSKFERLTDEKVEAYAAEIGRILGEENLDGSKPNPEQARQLRKRMLKTLQRARKQNVSPPGTSLAPIAPPAPKMPEAAAEKDPEPPPRIRGFLC